MLDLDVNTQTVRSPVWSGVHELSGLWFSAGWLSEEERIRRMLSVWEVNCRAYRFDWGDVLCFASARQMDCQLAPGLALCMLDGALYSASLTVQERAKCAVADLYIVSASQLLSLNFSHAQPLDLSACVDVGAYALHVAYDLDYVAADLTKSALKGETIRSLLGQAAPAVSAERKQFLAHLQRTAEPEISTRQGSIKPQTWRHALARMAIMTGLAKLLGNWQGVYLQRMMKMFEKGDLDEALRNALPLDGLSQSLGQAFSLPGRRSSLNLSSRLSSSSSISLADEITQRLRSLYRQAFEKYDRLGNIERAVFVLAELLNARQEALDYLVKHGRMEQAAMLALGWDMPPAMIIRLLMLAGDTAKAVQVARRDNAFADAVQLLQNDHAKLADQLRIEWAQSMVHSGEWLAAIDVVWRIPAARDLALKWLLHAEQSGTELAVRSLVQRAMLMPDTLVQYRAKIEALADPEQHLQLRNSLVQEALKQTSPSKALRRMVTVIAPALIADHGASASTISSSTLKSVIKLSQDAYLQADLPKLPHNRADEAKQLWQQIPALRWQAPAAGLHAAYDVVALPGQMYLVALGEAGAVVLDHLGQIKQRYGIPVFQLVAADSGQVALGIAPRDRVNRISRIDLVAQTVIDLGVLTFDHAASRFSGMTWTVVKDRRLMVLDVCEPGWAVLWHVAVEGTIVSAGFFKHLDILLAHDGNKFMDWTYSVSDRRLQSRVDLLAMPDLPLIAHPVGRFQQPRLEVTPNGQVLLSYRWLNKEQQLRIEIEIKTSFEYTLHALDQGLVLGIYKPEGSDICVLRLDANAQCVAVLHWPAKVVVRVREQAHHLILFDDAGRVASIDLQQSTMHTLSVV